MNIIAGISISILATAITGIIVGTTTGGTKMDDRDKPIILGQLPLAPNDSSGVCPSKSKWSNKNKQCCCGSNCCWDRCQWSQPPTNCIEGVQNSIWVFNTSLGYYQAFQNTGIYIFNLPEFLVFSFLESNEFSVKY